MALKAFKFQILKRKCSDAGKRWKGWRRTFLYGPRIPLRRRDWIVFDMKEDENRCKRQCYECLIENFTPNTFTARLSTPRLFSWGSNPDTMRRPEPFIKPEAWKALPQRSLRLPDNLQEARRAAWRVTFAMRKTMECDGRAPGNKPAQIWKTIANKSAYCTGEILNNKC